MKTKLIKRAVEAQQAQSESGSQASTPTTATVAPTGIAAIEAAVKSRQEPSATARKRSQARVEFAALFAN